jgi:hypothetical protein
MAQLKKKFIGDNQVGASKILLENNSYLRGRNAANGGDVEILKVTDEDVILFGSVPQVGSDASSANELVRYSQFASALDGLKAKAAVRAVSLSSIDLSDDGSDQSSIDGYSVQDGERVLLVGQSAPSENGIYVAVTAIDATTWVRSDDMDEASEFLASYVPVAMGSQAGTLWLVTNSSAPTLGVTAINFIKKADAAVISAVEEVLTFSAGDITNQYIDLAETALTSACISLFALNGPIQLKNVDYSISLTGGESGKTRISLLGDLATGGVAELVEGDKLVVQYSHI